MKERRKILIAITILIVLITLNKVPKLFINKKENILPEVKLKEIEKNKTFAIMVPDINGNGYIPYKGDEWPTEANDYYYSHLECVDNKGNKIDDAIEYNEKDNTALLDTGETTYCTLYFDKYNYMKVIIHDVVYDSEGHTTPAPIYMSEKVKKVKFVDYITENLNELEKNKEYWDITNTDKSSAGSVIAWIEPIDDNYDILYIGSKRKIRATSLEYAFMPNKYGDNINNPITNLSQINFNDVLDTSKTINMTGLFNHNPNLTEIIGIENWNVSNVTSMYTTFLMTGVTDLNIISNWDVSKVESMQGMFMRCIKIKNLDALNNWKTSSLTNMLDMFYDCTNLTDINGLSKWDTSHVNNMIRSFGNCTELSNITPLTNWYTSEVNDINQLFANCGKLSNITPLKDWNTSKVTSLYRSFYGSGITDTTAINDWNVSNVEDMRETFACCTNLVTLNLSNWKTTNLTNLQGTFAQCNKLNDITSLQNWNTSKVTTLYCTFLESGITDTTPIKNWDVSKVENMQGMFKDCSNLVTANFSNWQTTNLKDVLNMFSGCIKLKTIDMSNATFNQITNVSNYHSMFWNVPANAILTLKNEEQKNWIQTKPGFNGTIKTLA